MECCGDDFAVGDEVTWHLDGEPDVEWYESALGADRAQRITHAEEHHPTDEDFPEFSGQVLSITRAWCRYGPVGSDDRVHYPVPGSAEFQQVERSDGVERYAHTGLTFNGWIVELDLAA